MAASRGVGNIKLQREFSFLIMNCYTDIIIKRLGHLREARKII